MKKRALVLGITGQDGSHMADLLLEKGYEVHGLVRRSSTGNLVHLEPVLNKLSLHQGDLCDTLSIRNAIHRASPNEIYNFADQDNIDWSFSTPRYSIDVTARAVLDLLETVKDVAPQPCKVFQALSATMFGDSPFPQNEVSKHNPTSPYAIAKTAAYHLCRYYRDRGVFVSTAIYYNHLSLRRQGTYLMTKLCKAAVDIAAGRAENVALGDVDTLLDIGWAPEYVEAAWRMLQCDTSDDYVIGTGVGHSPRKIFQMALREAGVTDDPDGLITYNPQFVRPGPKMTLVAAPYKALVKLNWQAKVFPRHIVELLVEQFNAPAHRQ